MLLSADGPPRHGGAGHARPADFLLDDHAGAHGRGRTPAPPAARLRRHESRHEPPPPRRRVVARAPCTPRPPRRRPAPRHRHRPPRARGLRRTIQTTKNQTRGHTS